MTHGSMGRAVALAGLVSASCQGSVIGAAGDASLAPDASLVGDAATDGAAGTDDAAVIECHPPGTPTDPGGGGGARPARPRPFLPAGHADVNAANRLVADYTEAQWLALAPRQAPRLDLPCPATGRVETTTWDPHQPDQVRCGNATYDHGQPAGHISIEVLTGATVRLPSWPTPSGTQIPFGAEIDWQKSSFLASKLNVLASAYRSTGDERYARRIALALDRWADGVPLYFLTGVNSETPLTPAQAAARDWLVQRASDNNGTGNELKFFPTAAFDAIYESQALAQLSSERGRDVRAHIADDLFGDELDYITQIVPIERAVTTNLSMTYNKMGVVATVLGRGDVVAWLDRYLALTVLAIMRVGMYPESFGYHDQYIEQNVQVVANLQLYFDVWPADGDAERAIAARLAGYAARVDKGNQAAALAALPDGNQAPFGDTLLKATTAARTSTRSQLLPAYGHVVLGDGDGAQQVQVNLGFNDFANHTHDDVLGLTLYGFEREVNGNIRYSRIPGRRFTDATVAKNTVVVNRKEQSRTNQQGGQNAGHLFTSGDVLLYEPNLGGVSVAAVDGARAYYGDASRYDRLLVLDAIDPAHPILLDVFRVRGGTSHDWFFHGSTRFDETANASLALSRVDADYPLLPPGATWQEPTSMGDNRDWYGAFRDMSKATTTSPFAVTFHEDGGSRGTRVTVVPDGSSEVWLGRSPAPYRDTWPHTLYDHWRPSLLVRRTGADLDSRFVAVVEPFDRAPAVTRVELLPLAADDRDRLAVRVTFDGGREDVLLVSTDADAGLGGRPPAVVETRDQAFHLEGRVGVVSRAATETGKKSRSLHRSTGRPKTAARSPPEQIAPEYGRSGTRLVLVAGTGLDGAGQRLAQDRAAFEGRITDVVRRADGCTADAFVTDAALPTGTALRGRWVRLTFDRYAVVPNGSSYPLGIREQRGIDQLYRIDRVARQGDQTFVVLADDPMLAIDGDTAMEATRPRRTFEGAVRFAITLGTSH